MTDPGRIRIGGTPVSYIAPAGLPEPGSPVVLYVHGAGGSAAQFEPLIRELPRTPAPIAVDLPGHGESAGVAPASLADAASALATLLDALGVTGRVTCAGHSFGGLVALRLALLDPERVERVVTLASAARLRIHPDFADQARTRRWDLAALRAGFAPGCPAARREAVLSDLRRLRVGPGGSLGALDGADLTPRLAEVRAQALCLIPASDAIVSPRRGRALARGLPRARAVTVAGTRHYMHVERPRAVAAAMRDFIASETAGAVAAA